jgi:mannosylglycerate hydrolase
MATVHIVPHTHWDREWYQPFQVYRVRLVHLIDYLLDLLDGDPSYSCFTLDGQMVLLEDYLAIREAGGRRLERHVRGGRLMIGPWYVLPDEFLVHPESLIRNLLRGRSIGEDFGGYMSVGYLPDPFGHIGQMPQILSGFDIHVAALRRGLSDEPCELRWESPDGSQILLAHLREGYDNAARLPTDPENFERTIRELCDRLRPFCGSDQILLMNGTDHHEPQAEIPELISSVELRADRIEISALPTYFSALQAEIARGDLAPPLVKGELRHPKRHHLLAGVLSSRVRIKQQNDSCETALLRFAEPLAAFARPLRQRLDDRTIWSGHLTAPPVRKPHDLLREAWRLLLLCHPHDSICGCSIDEVHKEMGARFDQALQIAEVVTQQSMEVIARNVDTQSAAPKRAGGSLVVFNPADRPTTGRVRCTLELPAGLDPFTVMDPDGEAAPYRIVESRGRSLADLELDREGLVGLLSTVHEGRILGLSIQSVAVLRETNGAAIDVVLAQEAPPNQGAVTAGLERVKALLQDRTIQRFRALAHFATEVTIEMLASNVPGLGYKTYWLLPAAAPPEPGSSASGNTIRGGDLSLQVDGQGRCTLTQLSTGVDFDGLLGLRDVAEAGDSYTHAAIEGGFPIESPHTPVGISRNSDTLGEGLDIQMEVELPAELTPDRAARSGSRVLMPMEIHAQLSKGIPRLDCSVRLVNTARDHRLQLRFPIGGTADMAHFGGHFDTLEIPTSPAQGGSDWAEQPVPERPMLGFVAARRRHDGAGLMIACKGLREASVSPEGEIAVTLLRCFGWLSRDDLPTRKGGAGPSVAVPGGQSLGEHHFEVSVIPFQGDIHIARIEAEAFLFGMAAAGTGLHPGDLPHTAPFLQIEPAGQFSITGVKEAESGEGIVVRGVNLGEASIRGTIRCLAPLRAAWRARLDEEELQPCEFTAHDLAFDAGPHEIVTHRLVFET